MKKLTYEAQAEIFEEQDLAKIGHPYLMFAKFVFTDDQPNKNRQGVKYEDFDLLGKSAIDMPVKIRFMGKGLGGHKASVPIGHIKEIEETQVNGVNQLVALAALYSEEYPTEVKYLKSEYDAGKAPMVSWELAYDYDEKENGVTWKRKPIAKASTFVRDGAYGTRTSLLALASSDASEEELGRELQALASKVSNGGTTVDEEKEKEYQARITALENEVATLKTQTDDSVKALKSAEAEVIAKQEIIAQFQVEKLIADRTQAVTEIGVKIDSDPAKLEAKQKFWASLSNEAFAEYVSDMKGAIESAGPKKNAFASLQPNIQIPRPDATQQSGSSVDGLRERLRASSRGSVNTN